MPAKSNKCVLCVVSSAWAVYNSSAWAVYNNTSRLFEMCRVVNSLILGFELVTNKSSGTKAFCQRKGSTLNLVSLS